MSTILTCTSHRQHQEAIDALKKLILYETDEEKTNLLALLDRLNIKIDSFGSHRNDEDYQIYPPADRQDDGRSFYLSQPGKLRNNSSRRRRRRKTNENERAENDNFHYRNMITVRRISCHDIEERFEHQPMKNERQFMDLVRSIDLINTVGNREGQNKSRKYQTCSTGFQLSPKLSTSDDELISPSITNTQFPQRDIEKKMSHSVNLTKSKVISSLDLSVSSLLSTQLRTTGYDQIKPDVTIATPVTLDSRKNSSVVSYPMSDAQKKESDRNPPSPKEDIQDLVDQLKTCIDMLNLLLQNKPKHDKLRIHRKKKQRSSSPADHSKLMKTSIPKKNDLISEDITVRQCNPPINRVRTRYPNHIPTTYNDDHNELKRCLLVYCRNRNGHEKQRNAHCIPNHSISSEHFPSSLLNIDHDILSISKSTSILPEDDISSLRDHILH